LWNAADGTLLRTFSGHTYDVESVAFSPDGTKVLTGSADGTARLWLVSSTPTTPTVVRSADKVILVAGGGNYVGNSIVEQTEVLADLAFYACRLRGYDLADIFYLSAFDDWQKRDSNKDGFTDADARATPQALWTAIDTWAGDAGRLFVYLVDHGDRNTQTGEWFFRLNSTDFLSATDLDRHLDTLQSRTGAEVILIVDCCYAGGFVTKCKATAGQRRLVIASTTPSALAVFTLPKAPDSFSSFFFVYALLGNCLRDCFDWTRTSLRSMGSAAGQDPSMDADGDGDWDKWDRDIAATYALGSRIGYALNAPTIVDVAATQTIAGGQSVVLWAKLAPAPAAKEVWAVVVPSDAVYTPGQPVTTLTRVNLAWSASAGRWQATWRPVAEHHGQCTVTYFAVGEDSLGTRLVATPVSRLLRVVATSVRIPWRLLE
jgi:hypothetical protein